MWVFQGFSPLVTHFVLRYKDPLFPVICPLSFFQYLISSFPGGDGRSPLSSNSFLLICLPRMGQRHNRRRTRRSSNRNTISQTVLAHPALGASTRTRSLCQPPLTDNSPTCISRGSPAFTLAPSWHHGYTAWQTRERHSRLESGLEQEQCRLFGGEPGDDVSLCYRMLEYFGGLDYIDS